jgi:phosphoribosylformimino-5-aminoimidazole carboxamide ribotide isomerase
MLAIPAIDLREGAVVQLVGGDYANESVRLENPLEVAREWVRAGFTRLHCVDLDAATGRGSNDRVIRDLLDDHEAPYQVGGGVRSSDRVAELLDAGAAYVVVGTRAIEEPEWLIEMADLHQGRIIVATDVRERLITTRGWAKDTKLHVVDFVEEYSSLPLAGFLVTAVHREGLMEGTDMRLMEDVAESSAHPVYASGGIATIGELRALGDRGVAGAVLGMALYTGALDPRAVAEEFGA